MLNTIPKIDHECLLRDVRAWAAAKGFYDADVDRPRSIYKLKMLIVTELAEIVEAIRHGNPPCEKPDCEMLCSVGEELADTIIRYVQMCDEHSLRISDIFELAEKMSIVTDIEDEIGWVFTGIVYLKNSSIVDQAQFLRVLFSLAAQYKIDLQFAIDKKMEFNWTRPHKNGKLH